MNHNRFNLGRLQELQYPAALRVDGSAETLVDDNGDIYLYPVEEHDFSATVELHDAGLTDAEVVADKEGEELIRYPVESDVISLASVLNSLEGSQFRKNVDVKPVLMMVGRMLEATSGQIEKLPAGLKIADLAINRTTGQSELLAPYHLDEAQVDRKYDLFMGLCADMLQKATTKEFKKHLSESIDRVILELGWRHGE